MKEADVHSQGKDDKRHHTHHERIYSVISITDWISVLSILLGKPSNFSPDTISLRDHKDFLKTPTNIELWLF